MTAGRGIDLDYLVLGPLEAWVGSRRLPLAGRRQRRLLAGLLVHAPGVAAADRLTELLWGDDPPGDARRALHVQVSRLRRALREAGGGDAIVTEPHGYRIRAPRERVDADRFEDLVRRARAGAGAAEALAAVEAALALWRGAPYEELRDVTPFREAATRLEEVRLGALELRAELLLALGRAGEAVEAMRPVVLESPLRERPRALLMEALYRHGRPADALAVFDDYRKELAHELGLEPSPALRRLELEILRRDDPGSGAPPGMEATLVLPVRFLNRGGGRRLAIAATGAGPDLVVLPAWCSHLAATGSGSDPRSPLLARLAARARLVLYDRGGTGLSSGPAELTLASDEEESLVVLDGLGLDRPAILAISQAGPAALRLAARHPERVGALVLLGAYASGRRTFVRPAVRASLPSLVRAHWGIAARALADMLLPGATPDEIATFARMQRESATPEVAARALEAVYDADVGEELGAVRAPTLVLHYTDDVAVPFSGGAHIAAAVAGARLVPLPGRSHLPRPEDLDRVAELVADFLVG